MKINSANVRLYNKASFSHTFKGLWGEEKYSCRNITNPEPNTRKIFLWHSDYYKKTYYPFYDEDELTINKSLKEYNSTYRDEEENFDITWTAIIGTTLPILTKEYNLFRENKLTSDAGKIIERVIKTMVK